MPPSSNDQRPTINDQRPTLPIPCVLIDIDGTLADCRHRLHHISGPHKDYDAFYRDLIDDPPIQAVMALADMLCVASQTMGEIGCPVAILLVSGRPEPYRAPTEAWLALHGVHYDELLMRPAGDYRADWIIKEEILAQIQHYGFAPFLAIDDRPRIVEMWRKNGIKCLAADWHGSTETQTYAPALLTLMVGPAGAGKTKWLSDNVLYHQVVSTDSLRQDIAGSILDQSRNDQVFAAAHAIIAARLNHGLPVTFDATNLRKKDRLAVVELAKGGPVKYVICDRPLDKKLTSRGWRSEELILKHHQRMLSVLPDILAGDSLPNVTIEDTRKKD